MATLPTRLVRSRVVRAWDHLDATVVLGQDGSARQFSGDSAVLARAVLEFFAQPHDRAELLAHLEELSGAPVEPTTVIDQLLEVLVHAGALREAPTLNTAPAPSGAPKPRTRLLLGLTGAVATANAPVLVSALQRRGFDVRVAATRNALRFVARAALEAQTHHRVHARLFQHDPGETAPHIQLAEWAEVMVVCPASATTIARLATGSCADVVSATAIATRAPVVLVPSMNPGMYSAPAVQRNLEQLRADGFHVVHPGHGTEVAHRPDARTSVYGVALPFDEVAEIVAALVRLRTPAPPRVETGEAHWQALWTRTPVEQHPWTTERIDEDIVAALERHARAPGRFLDVGTGTGTVAREAARRGFDVVATDVAPRALELAKQASGDAARVRWVHDDVLATALPERAFDVVHDRGCLHVLPPAKHAAWATAMARLVRPGGTLIVKAHSAREPAMRGAHRFTAGEIATLLGDAFDLISAEETDFPGPVERPPLALLCVLRRRPEVPAR